MRTKSNQKSALPAPPSRPGHFLRFSRATWLSLEVFNLMQVQNQAGMVGRSPQPHTFEVSRVGRCRR